MDQPDHHFFVSYARADDRPPPDARPADLPDRGWVTRFLKGFSHHLGRALGRPAEGERYWIDYRDLPHGAVLDDAIRAHLAGSRFLLPILSTSWFASDWCRRELATFLELHPDGPERIFPVWMEPIDPARLVPEAHTAWQRVRKPIGCRLWYHDAAQKARTRWYPFPDYTDRTYTDLQQDLARDMAARLRVMLGAEAGAPGAGPELPAAVPEPFGPIPGEHLVFVGGGSDDAAEIGALAECLREQYGLGYVVPLLAQADRNPRLKPSDLNRNLRLCLKSATSAVIYFRAGPPEQVQEQTLLYHQSRARARSNGASPDLYICRAGHQTIGCWPQGTRVHDIGEECPGAQTCLQGFVAHLTQGAAP